MLAFVPYISRVFSLIPSVWKTLILGLPAGGGQYAVAVILQYFLRSLFGTDSKTCSTSTTHNTGNALSWL